MNDYNRNSMDPWEDWEYATGRTKPPKNYRAALAVLLILVIFLCGIVSALGILNIRLTRQLNHEESDPLGVAFATETTQAATQPAEAETAPPQREDVTVSLQTAPQGEAGQTPAGLTLQEIYRRNISSVVSITAASASGTATGSGVIFSEQGYIVTNNHVISGASAITVLLTDGRELDASLIGKDSVSDLAVLRIYGDDLTPVQFGDSESIQVGDTVVAIGDPLGIKFRGTMTDGIISAINRDVEMSGRTMNLIQTNAALNSGNSGGPLINRYGQVIGINTMKIGAFADTAGVEGIGFAIPSATVKAVVENIIAYGYVPGRPTLGLQLETISRFYQHFYRLPAGLLVSRVSDGSAAEQAGIQEGDILLTIDGEAVTGSDSLNAILFSHNVGDTVSVTVYRGGETLTAQFALDEAKG